MSVDAASSEPTELPAPVSAEQIGSTQAAPDRTDQVATHSRQAVASEPLAPVDHAAARLGLVARELRHGGRTIGGHIRRDDQHPVPAATLTLISQRGQQVSRATADGSGSYTIEPPAPGSYVLIVSADGHQPT
ncbi:carboxypeptidase-like regulatory domain-containing protein, partial [Nocardia sp.]|uniref:carboxypeptidase-like regulatory domain-containing protein n=1 Tax=Nocardia sp. TaxID=1821 RepID=UPI002638506E